MIQLVGRDNSKAGELKVSLNGTVERTKRRTTNRALETNVEQPSTSTGLILNTNGMSNRRLPDAKNRDTIMSPNTASNVEPEEPLPEGWELR